MEHWQSTLENLGMNNFWAGKRVLLTGHTGFKGSWLSLWLQHLGAELTGYALPPPTQPNLFDLAHIATGMQHITGDINDLATLSQTMQHTQPQIVIHMAAQALVRRAYTAPVATYATNVMGTVHLLEAVRHTPSVHAVLVVTTDKCYQNQEWLWGYRENDTLGGFDPYSNSKACAELVTAAYRSSFFNPARYTEHQVAIATARAGNVIGGGDWAEDRLIPDILRALSEQKPVIIRNPHATRPWQHVLEALHGYLLLAEQLYQHGPDYGESWNFGPNEYDVRPVEWIAEHLTQHWGENMRWQTDNQPQPHEAHYLKLDCAKAKSRLGWQPKYQLQQALDLTMAWQHAWLKQQDMREFSLNQILRYEK